MPPALLQRPRHPAVVAFDTLALDVEKAKIVKPPGFHFEPSARLAVAAVPEGAVDGAVEGERSLPPVATGAAPHPHPHHLFLHNLFRKVTQFFKPKKEKEEKEEKHELNLLFVDTLLQQLTSRGGSSTFVGQSFQSLWKFFSEFWKKLHDTFGLPEVFDEFDAEQLAKFREAISICLKQIWEGIQDLEQFIEYILKGSSLLFTIFEIFGTIKQNPELEANLILDYVADILDKVFAMLAGLLRYPKVIANPSEKVPVEVPVDRYALAKLIKEAAAENKVVRVLGSGHSFPNAIRVAAAGSRPAVNVVLDSADFRGYEVVEKYPDGSARVRVGAGMHLGTDHSVPLKPDVPIRITSKKGYIATINNQQVGTLNVKLFKDDLAMIDLGGIDHQTVGGFLSTGSNGASGFDTNRNLEDHILGFTIIDGQGEFHKITKEDPLFAAVGCSMGLLGVIIEVELKAVPIFGLQGTQINGFIKDAKDINFDLFGDFPGQGYETLDEFMHKEDYGRILWWPQEGVEKVTLWKGKAISAEDVKNHTIQEYVEVGNVTTAYSGRRAMQKLAGTIFGLADEIPYLTDLSRQAGLPKTIAEKIENKLYGTYADLLNSLFITDGTLNFRDYSFKLIPMDNYVDDILMKTEFTELWVEANDAQFLVNKLRDYYLKNGWSAAGNYSLEIYSGGKSPFWMSPAYGRDVVRFDWFWYGGNQGDPVTTGFFPQFWEFFKDELQKAGKQPFRLHWGKWLPDPFSYDVSTGPKTTSWIQYLTYGREKEFAEFKAIREKLDPNDVFLNDYWSFHLGIQPKGREALIPQPKLQFNTRTLQQRVCASAGIPERDLRIATPDSLPALQKVVQEAFEKKEILKPVGTQYCYNEAAFVPVDGKLVDVNKFLHSVYAYSDLNPETSLKEVDPNGTLSDATLESVKKRNVIRVEAGATIQMINERLWPKTARKAGISEGYKTVKVHQCYDQLSIAGSVAVGAHGPGLRAPISDSVLSILLVTVDSQGVKNVIIERTQGVTDRQRFEAQKQNFPGRVYLEQNDDVFYTALLSLGGTGIFYSFLLEVEDAHFVLRQSTFLELSNQRDVAALEAAIARAEKPDSFGIMMVANPYTKKEAVLMEYQAIPGNLNDEQKKLMDAPLGLPRTVPNWGIEILIDLIVTSARTNAKDLVPLFLRLFLQLLTWPPATSKVVQDVPTALGLGSLESANANVTEVLAPYNKPSDVTDGLKQLFATAEKLAEETNQPGEPGFIVMPAMLTGVVLLELVGSSKAKLAQTYSSEKNYAIEMFGMNGYPTSYTALKEITERSIAANPSYRPHWGEELFDLVKDGKAQALFPGYNDFRTIFNAHFSEALPVFGNQFMNQLLNPPTNN